MFTPQPQGGSLDDDKEQGECVHSVLPYCMSYCSCPLVAVSLLWTERSRSMLLIHSKHGGPDRSDAKFQDIPLVVIA